MFGVACRAFLIVYLLGLSVSWAQQGNGVGPQQNFNQLGKAGFTGSVQNFDDRYKGVKGNPFYLEDWAKAEVKFSDGNTMEFEGIRYNVYENELTAKRNAHQEVVLNERNVLHFTIYPNHENAQTFLKSGDIGLEVNNIDRDQFLKVLFQGKNICLFEALKKSYTKANYEGAYSLGTNYDEFSAMQSRFYLKTESGEFEEIRLKKSSITKAMQEHKKEVDAFIKKENLRFDKTEDLIKVLTYWDQLIQNG